MVGKKHSPRGKAGGEAPTELLLGRIAELEERIAKLESARDAAVAGLVTAPAVPRPAPLPRASMPAPAAAAAAPAVHEDISEEILMVIAASVAAFLGERAHVRQVRLVASEAWAQQGRVSVMASHRWAVHR
jgi:methylmalonyl-CoA carboxyltransferase 12S subunit